MNFCLAFSRNRCHGCKRGRVKLFSEKKLPQAENANEMLAQKEQEYAEKICASVSRRSTGFLLMKIILPRESRRKLIKAFQMLKK